MFFRRINSLTVPSSVFEFKTFSCFSQWLPPAFIPLLWPGFTFFFVILIVLFLGTAYSSRFFQTRDRMVSAFSLLFSSSRRSYLFEGFGGGF